MLVRVARVTLYISTRAGASALVGTGDSQEAMRLPTISRTPSGTNHAAGPAIERTPASMLQIMSAGFDSDRPARRRPVEAGQGRTVPLNPALYQALVDLEIPESSCFM
jgi:hypothetical protein